MDAGMSRLIALRQPCGLLFKKMLPEVGNVLRRSGGIEGRRQTFESWSIQDM
jgi:hypothetical protein